MSKKLTIIGLTLTAALVVGVVGTQAQAGTLESITKVNSQNIEISRNKILACTALLDPRVTENPSDDVKSLCEKILLEVIAKD